MKAVVERMVLWRHTAVAQMHPLRERSLRVVWQHVCHKPNVCAESTEHTLVALLSVCVNPALDTQEISGSK